MTEEDYTNKQYYFPEDATYLSQQQQQYSTQVRIPLEVGAQSTAHGSTEVPDRVIGIANLKGIPEVASLGKAETQPEEMLNSQQSTNPDGLQLVSSSPTLSPSGSTAKLPPLPLLSTFKFSGSSMFDFDRRQSFALDRRLSIPFDRRLSVGLSSPSTSAFPDNYEFGLPSGNGNKMGSGSDAPSFGLSERRGSVDFPKWWASSDGLGADNA